MPKSFHTSSLKTCDICRSIFISGYHLFNVTGLREKIFRTDGIITTTFCWYQSFDGIRSRRFVLLVSEFYDHLITTKLEHGTRAKGQILFNSHVWLLATYVLCSAWFFLEIFVYFFSLFLFYWKAHRSERSNNLTLKLMYLMHSKMLLGQFF